MILNRGFIGVYPESLADPVSPHMSKCQDNMCRPVKKRTDLCVCVCVCVCLFVLVYATFWGSNVSTRIVKTDVFDIVGTGL